MLELFHDWDSLMSFKVRACLAEKGLDWQSKRVVLRNFEHLSPDYLAINPNGLVPTLIHDGQVVVESTMINEYLNEVYPEPELVPATAYERAQMRIWSKYFDDVVHPTLRIATFQLKIRQRFMHMLPDELEQLIAHHPMPERAQAFRQLVNTEVDYVLLLAGVNKLRSIFTRMETILAGSEWLAGKTFSLADVNTMPLVDRIEQLQLNPLWDAYPAVKVWKGKIQSRPAYKMAQPAENQRMPQPQKDVVEKLWVLLAQELDG